jgi:hypothetical protein
MENHHNVTGDEGNQATYFVSQFNMDFIELFNHDINILSRRKYMTIYSAVLAFYSNRPK